MKYITGQKGNCCSYFYVVYVFFLSVTPISSLQILDRNLLNAVTKKACIYLHHTSFSFA